MQFFHQDMATLQAELGQVQIAENIAQMGDPVKFWMDSPPHRKNVRKLFYFSFKKMLKLCLFQILLADTKEMGIGQAEGNGQTISVALYGHD